MSQAYDFWDGHLLLVPGINMFKWAPGNIKMVSQLVTPVTLAHILYYVVC